jgi:hypothetical protein
VYGGARGAAAVAFLESFRLFLSKKLIMIEILKSFLQYRIDAILIQINLITLFQEYEFCF